jgi:hypothetical protein
MTSELPGVTEARGGRANGECACLRGSHTAEWTDTEWYRSGPPFVRRTRLLPLQPLLLEFRRGQVAQRRVDPLPVIHVAQEPTELAVPIPTCHDTAFEKIGRRVLGTKLAAQIFGGA